MVSLTTSLPLQLLCQLLASTPGFNGTDVDLSQVQIQVPNLPNGYVAYPDIELAYKVHNKIVTWQVARQECILEGAQLALIDSYTKYQYLQRQRNSMNYTHVGIVRMYDDEEWIGVSTGLPVPVIPWALGEPSGERDCVMAVYNYNGLANGRCNVRIDYVCEIPIPQNYNVEEHLIAERVANQN